MHLKHLKLSYQHINIIFNFIYNIIMKENTIYFWKISTKQHYLEASLVKLNVSEIQIRNFVNNINIIGEDKVLVAPRANSGSHLAWNKDCKAGFDGFKEQGYVYKGELEISKDEIDSLLSANKYNL